MNTLRRCKWVDHIVKRTYLTHIFSKCSVSSFRTPYLVNVYLYWACFPKEQIDYNEWINTTWHTTGKLFILFLFKLWNLYVLVLLKLSFKSFRHFIVLFIPGNVKHFTKRITQQYSIIQPGYCSSFVLIIFNVLPIILWCVTKKTRENWTFWPKFCEITLNFVQGKLFTALFFLCDILHISIIFISLFISGYSGSSHCRSERYYKHFFTNNRKIFS